MDHESRIRPHGGVVLLIVVVCLTGRVSVVLRVSGEDEEKARS